MIDVFQDRDRIILDLHGRRQDVLLPCDAALKLAEALEAAAGLAELEPPTLFHGDKWRCQVESAHGHVCVRFHPPGPGLADRVPFTVVAARKLAEVLRFKADQAEAGLRLVLKSKK